MRTRAYRNGDTAVPYAVGMAEGIDRAAWARTIRSLLSAETRGNQTRFAQMVGVTPKTVSRWLAGDVDVSENSVRQVARALGLSPVKMLVDLGYYQPDEMPAGVEPDASVDPEEQIIRDAGLPPSKQHELIEHLRQMRDRDAQQRADEIAALIRFSRGA